MAFPVVTEMHFIVRDIHDRNGIADIIAEANMQGVPILRCFDREFSAEDESNAVEWDILRTPKGSGRDA